MAVTAFSSVEETPDLTLLNVSRLFTRLEHNLVSPGSELRTLRKSEFQRMRVRKNVEYARSLLYQLERSLPQLKQLDRRHEAQTEIARDRQLLKRLQGLLEEEEEDVRAEAYKDGDEVDDGDADDEWKELFAKPLVEETDLSTVRAQEADKDRVVVDRSTATTTTTATATATTAATTTPAQPPSTLRHRQHTQQQQPTRATAQAKATGSEASPQPTKLSDAEQSLSGQRLEQEDLTSSLLSLAGQLKTSSQSFQSTLENEKSVLDRAVTGIDKTTTTMEAAGQRMGMLRKMSEGKGWWGRMMLYAWIVGLWVVAILIVYVGPKMRF